MALALGLLPACRRLFGPSEVEVVLDPAVHFQTWEGFGTSINAWSPRLAETFDRPEFRTLFLNDLGANVLRVDLHGDSVPQRADPGDISYRDYVLSGPGARADVYLRAAAALTRQSGGSVRVVASVWSPPAWMKQNGTLGNGNQARKNFTLSDADLGVGAENRSADGATGDAAERARFLHQNKLRPDRYEHFARSLVEWARLYREHGVELYGLSPQNEPRFSHWFGSCVYTPTELAEVVRVIERTFEAEGEAMPRLFAPETMSHDESGNRAYLDALFRGKAGSRRVDALAVHGYVDGYRTDGDPTSPARFARLAQNYARPIWFTEGGTGGHEWPEPTRGLAMSIVNALTLGQASLLLPWQLVDVEPSEHALATVAGPTKKTAVAAHFFQAIRPGMRRVAAEADGTDALAVVGFEDAQRGEIAVVVVNREASPTKLVLRLKGRSAPVAIVSALITDRTRTRAKLELGQGAIALPPESVASFVVRLR